MDSIWNYLKYSRGLIKRSGFIGIRKTFTEFARYFKKYSKLPYRLGFDSDINYNFFVFYNYIKITFFLWDESSDFIMNFVPRRIQKFLLPKINPLGKKYLVVDKIAFYQNAIRHSLPVPETYFYTRDGRILTIDGLEIQRKDLAKYEGNLMFSKIVDGSAAVGARKESFVLGNLDVSENRIYQAAMVTHSDLLELSPTKALNCIKISSYYTNSGDVKIQLSFLKLGGVNSIVDNIGGKAGGGIAVPIDISTGRLKGIGYKEVGKELRVSRIPTKGKTFEGFKVPFFQESVELVKKAHKEVFHELKHIGWDVGITDEGPVLIEGNSGADMFAAQMICRPFNYYNDDLIQENLIHE